MKKFKLALQLYSIRDDMEKNMEAALAKVKEVGYDYVEFAGYYGRSAEEVRNILDKYNLKCISVHQSHTDFLEEEQSAVDYLKVLGAKYCAIPWCGADILKGTNKWEKTVDDFTSAGRNLKKNGIQLLYHNHELEFRKVDDKFLLDWIFESIPSDILQPQIDTCWVRYAGYDPSEYILKYSGRVSVVHIKDFVCKNIIGGPVYSLIGNNGKEEKKASKEENGFEYRPVGHGIQDIPKILEASERAGADCLVVEQDQSTDRPAMESAKLSREYLTSLGL